MKNLIGTFAVLESDRHNILEIINQDKYDDGYKLTLSDNQMYYPWDIIRFETKEAAEKWVASKPDNPIIKKEEYYTSVEYKGYVVPIFFDDPGQDFYFYWNNKVVPCGTFNADYIECVKITIDRSY